MANTECKFSHYAIMTGTICNVLIYLKKSICANILSYIQKLAKTEIEREFLTFPAQFNTLIISFLLLYFFSIKFL